MGKLKICESFSRTKFAIFPLLGSFLSDPLPPPCSGCGALCCPPIALRCPNIVRRCPLLPYTPLAQSDTFPSCPTLSYTIPTQFDTTPHCLTLPYIVQHCPEQSYTALTQSRHCPTLSYTALPLPYTILNSPDTLPHCPTLPYPTTLCPKTVRHPLSLPYTAQPSLTPLQILPTTPQTNSAPPPDAVFSAGESQGCEWAPRGKTTRAEVTAPLSLFDRILDPRKKRESESERG